MRVSHPRLIQTNIWRAWHIKWPYKTERYVYFGAKADAEKAAKSLTGKWPYEPSIRELKL